MRMEFPFSSHFIQIYHDFKMCRKEKTEEVDKVENQHKKHRNIHLNPANCVNGVTYLLFTVFPVLLFSTILILKLRSSYLQTISHLESAVGKLNIQLNDCFILTEAKMDRIHKLEDSEEQCKLTMGQAAQTLNSLSYAFRKQWDQSGKLKEAYNKSQLYNADLSQELNDNKVQMNDLQEQRSNLMEKIQNLQDQLSNVTNENIDLQTQLGKLEVHLDSLRSNTTRLEGEKEGLEKALSAKSMEKKQEVEDKKNELESIEIAKYKEKENYDKLNKSREIEDEESIKKIVKEQIVKLGLNPINKTLSNSTADEKRLQEDTENSTLLLQKEDENRQ